VVTPSELTQVTHLLALFAGVVSTTPVVVSTWPTLLTTPFSEDSDCVVPRVGSVPVPTARLSHAIGGPDTLSRNMSVDDPVTTPLAKSSGHRLGVDKPPSPQGAKGKEAMEIGDNDLGHLSYGLELDDINDDLPHSTIVRDDHDLDSEGDEMQEAWLHSSTIPSVSSSPQRDKDGDAMETDDINKACCLGQPTTVLIEMSSPRDVEGSAGGGHSHEGGLLTSGTTKKKRRSGSAKNSAGNVGGHDKTKRHQRHLTHLSKQ